MQEEKMEKSKVKDIIMEAIKGGNTASMATIKDGKPWVRYIACHRMGDTMSLYCSTSIHSRKIEQIKKDPNVHITMGWNEAEMKGPYLQIAAKAVIKTDRETREKCWLPEYAMFFKTPDNPHYCIIEFVPEYIEVWGYSPDMTKYLVYTP